MSSPTKRAEEVLQTAIGNFQRIHSSSSNSEIASLAHALQQTAWALQYMAVGMRATYQKLEEVEKLLPQRR